MLWRVLERQGSRRALFGPGWSANSPQDTPAYIPQQRLATAFCQCDKRNFWMKSEEGMAEKKKGGGRWTQSCPKSSELVTLRHPGRNSTVLPRGVMLPEEGNGDTAAMPTWEIQVVPQPLKVLWKHDTGRAALLSSLIQSPTNGSKEGRREVATTRSSQGLLLQQ